jgi:hypothetical protein
VNHTTGGHREISACFPADRRVVYGQTGQNLLNI